MGITNYLIEGVSGAGKTTVAEALERRGYHVIHGDRTLAYVGDPKTGEPLDVPPDARIEWTNQHWIWPVAQVKALIADPSHPATFFCGGSRNSHHFIDLFDAVFILDVDAATLTRRLIDRPTDEFGGKPDERAQILHLHQTQQNLPTAGIRIDATAPLDQVIDNILQHCT